MDRPKILCVDDEPLVLEGLSLHLRSRYELLVATSGARGLELLREQPDIMVIISDMRMPGMDGSQFLAACRKLSPDARRILLTGHGQMNTTIAAINDGQICRFLTKPCDPRALHEAIEFAVSDYEAQTVERHVTRCSARREALLRDGLSGLASREGLLEIIAELLVERQLESAAAALYFFDVSVPADTVMLLARQGLSDPLSGIADRLREEAPAALCIARFDSRTYAVLERIPADFGAHALADRARRLVRVLRRPITVQSLTIQLDVTAGVAPTSDEGCNAQLFTHRADLARHDAATKGNGSVVVFHEDLASAEEYRCKLLAGLRLAIADHQLALHYQPIVDIRARRIHAVEALVRWSHPEFGSVSPAVFVPLAESAGLAIALGDWVLQRACRDARLFIGTNIPRVAVNVSVIQLLAPDFCLKLANTLAAAGLAPEALEVEVTESVFAQNIDQVAAVLTEVRALGVRISIDDFGTGYSSLAYLHRLPANTIKTDAVFSRDFATGGEAIIRATLAIARNLGRELIIEGIETAAMVGQALATGATLMQGYIFAKPMPLESLPRWRDDFLNSSPAASATTVSLRSSRRAAN